METNIYATPLSDNEFIIYTPTPLSEELKEALATFTKITLCDENYTQFEISPYRIWNSLFSQIDPLKQFEKISPLFSTPPGLAPSIIQHLEKGKTIISAWQWDFKSKSLFEVDWGLWKSGLRPGQLEVLKYLVTKPHPGIVYLPGGYGKTRVGLALVDSLLAASGTSLQVLIVTPNEVVKKHWLNEIAQLLIPAANRKKMTQSLVFTTYRQLSQAQAPWPPYALMLLDEVHESTSKLLHLLAKNKLLTIGLTASPQFAADLEAEAFATLGPIYPVKVQSSSPEQISKKQIHYFEMAVSLQAKQQTKYISAPGSMDRFKIASQNPAKEEIVAHLLKRHFKEKIIIIGEYLQQLNRLATRFNLPFITGHSTTAAREKVYRDFNCGRINCFISSSITNQAINLPEADCLIQVSESSRMKMRRYSDWEGCLEKRSGR